MTDTADASLPERIAAALGLAEAPDVEPAHDPVEGSIAVRADGDGHLEVLYVARDPFPPRRFWPADGSRG